ncbi:MAG: Coenzyme F420 hydrogenase/dehydrogenase, beta subunit C-terminal domain [Candidatus Cloacimonetes bacterium]|nr:Coenzyme F420 hydrogenase/dehydrogenase, beta subunit C-terminal domain [Candidatus Cloacimonadota bacterium]
MKSRKDLSFEDLLDEVIHKDLCNRCGGCVSFCSANSIDALKIGKDGFPEYKYKDKCLECGICYLICPKTRTLEEELKSHFDWRYPLGNFIDVFSARSTDEDVLKVATDGGVVTSILIYLLENKVIDGAIVSKRMGTHGRKPIIAKTRSDIIDAAGSSFAETQHLDELGNIYSTSFPIIKVIKESASESMKKLAIVGTPCQIEAIRKMQLLNIVPSNLIIFTIGLFCMQCFTIEDLSKKNFAKTHKIDLDDIEKVNIKENLILKMKSNVSFHIPLDEIEEIARPACLACNDFSNEFADISVGGVGSQDGYTTVMVRTSIGKQVYAEALYQHYVENSHGLCHESRKVNEKSLLRIIKDFAVRKKIRSEEKNKSMNK